MRTALTCVAAVAIVLVGAVLVFALIRWDDAQQRANDRRYRETLERVNSTCGGQPRAIENRGSYWKVRCPDGVVKLVVP